MTDAEKIASLEKRLEEALGETRRVRDQGLKCEGLLKDSTEDAMQLTVLLKRVWAVAESHCSNDDLKEEVSKRLK